MLYEGDFENLVESFETLLLLLSPFRLSDPGDLEMTVVEQHNEPWRR